jgi:hypothetical protein
VLIGSCSTDRLEQAVGGIARSLLARAGPGESRISRAHSEIDLNEVRRRPRSSRGERGRGRGVASICLVTALSGKRGERCRIRA